MKINSLNREMRDVAARELLANPLNWKHHPEHQRRAMSAALAEIGFAGTVLAYPNDDGTLTLIDGHMRVSIADPDELVPVTILNLSADDPRIRKILLTHDPLGALSEAESAPLDFLMGEVDIESPDVALMLQGLADSFAAQPPEPTIPVEVMPPKTRRKKSDSDVASPVAPTVVNARAVHLTFATQPEFDDFLNLIHAAKALFDSIDTTATVVAALRLAVESVPDDGGNDV